MDAQYQRTTGKPKLHISVNPRAIPLAMIIMGKSIHGFSSVFYMGMGLGAAEAPLLGSFSNEDGDGGDKTL